MLSKIRNIKNIDYINNNVYNNIDKKVIIRMNNININYYITLSTTPDRFFDPEICNVLYNLSNQTIKPKKIIVSYCKKYKRTEFIVKSEQEIINRINFLKEKFTLLCVIRTNDYGPATKLLGFLEYNNMIHKLKDNDVLIVVDDDMLYSSSLVMSHLYCNQLYMSDVIAVDERFIIKSWEPYTFNTSDILYKDNYNGFLYGWLSFSITYRSAKNLINFYNIIIDSYPDIFYHDDLLFTLYYYQQKLYGVENRIIPINNKKTNIDKVHPLRAWAYFTDKTKVKLEHRVFRELDIKINNITNKFINKQTKYNIYTSIPKRNIIIPDNIEVLNPVHDIHIVPTYIDNIYLMLTISIFANKYLNSNYTLVININDYKYTINIIINDMTKFTYIIKINNINILPKKHNNVQNYKIMQTASTKEMSKNRYYSIMTILNNGTEYPYIYFDNNDLFKFIKKYFTQIVIDSIRNLIPGAYISDLFRYCYLYIFGGIYFDCKKILFIPLINYINYTGNNEIYIKDMCKNYTYNAIMISIKESKIMLSAIKDTILNIINNRYCEDPLSISGPGLLSGVINKHYIDYKYYYKNTCTSKHHSMSYITLNNDTDKRMIIQNTYNGYYQEDNYGDTAHYDKLWHVNKVYNTDLSKKYKDVNLTNIKILI